MTCAWSAEGCPICACMPWEDACAALEEHCPHEERESVSVSSAVCACVAGSGGTEALQAAAAAAADGAESTQGMAAVAGRSSYVPPEALRDVPDPGARAVAIWMHALSAALQAKG